METMKLFTPCKIGNVEIPNRVVLPGMNVALADDDRLINEKFLALYGERAKQGVGLIIPAPLGFMDDGLCSFTLPGGAAINVPGGQERIKMLIDRIHQYDSKICLQLLHPGREGESRLNNGQQPVAPSAIKEADFMEMPRELTIDEIHIIRDRFIEAADILYKLGADGVELHAAHGYLLCSFMSARANHRTDEYGGSFEGRMRIMKEIIEGINAIKPANGFVSARINGMDWLDDGIQVEDAIEMAKYLEACGLDVLNVSCGSYASMEAITEVSAQPEETRSFFVKPIKQAVSIPVIAVNNIKRPETAERILQEGVSDFVGMARGLMAEPEFLKKIKAGRPDLVHNCINCLYCQTRGEAGQDINCAMNPYCGRESFFNEDTIRRDGDGKRIVVIGGGPGGMVAALTAAKRGYQVTLFEKGSALSGSMLIASQGIGKEKFTMSANGYINEIKENENIEVRLNTEVTDIEQITSLNPHGVIVAAGAAPVKPPIPGSDKPHVIMAHDMLLNKPEFHGKKIALVGSGMTGLQAAEYFLDRDNEITIYEMVDTIAPGSNRGNRAFLIKMLSDAGVRFKTQYRLNEIHDRTLDFTDLAANEAVTVDADVVVLSLGVRPRKELRTMLEGKIKNLHFIGDCNGGTLIPHATGSALETAWYI